MGLTECSSSVYMHTQSWQLTRDPLFKHISVCQELVYRQDQICNLIYEAYASTCYNILYANVSTTDPTNNMLNALLNSIPTLNGSNGTKWLLAIEAYLMSQGLWSTVSEYCPIDPRATTLSRLACNATDVQCQAAIAGVNVVAQTAAEDKQKNYDKLNLQALGCICLCLTVYLCTHVDCMWTACGFHKAQLSGAIRMLKSLEFNNK